MFKKPSDSSIIEGIRNQDDSILRWLYDNYFETVRKYVLQNSGHEEDVSDLFQDAIIILYNQIRHDTFNLTSDLKGYFYGIARNRWKENLRQRKEMTYLDDNFPDHETFEDNSDLQLERIISRSFTKLKPEFQTVLRLYADGYSYEEIAKKMKLTSETYARRKKYLGKEALMEIVREDPEYQEYLRFLK